MACHCACDGSAASALRGTEGSTLSGSKCWRQGRQHTEIFCRARGAQSPVRPTKLTLPVMPSTGGRPTYTVWRTLWQLRALVGRLRHEFEGCVGDTVSLLEAYETATGAQEEAMTRGPVLASATWRPAPCATRGRPAALESRLACRCLCVCVGVGVSRAMGLDVAACASFHVHTLCAAAGSCAASVAAACCCTASACGSS